MLFSLLSDVGFLLICASEAGRGLMQVGPDNLMDLFRRCELFF